MKDELRYIGKKIVDNNLALAKKVVFNKDSSLNMQINRSHMPLTDRIEYRAKLIGYFGEALYEDLDMITDKVTTWAIRAAEIAINDHISLSSTLRGVYTYRTVIWDVFTEEVDKREFAPITMLDVTKIIDPLLDLVGNIIGEEFEKHNHKLMQVAYTALEELSVPVVPIVEGVSVVPLVGGIDTHRAKLIMDVTLHETVKSQLTDLIFDVSGVPIIDTMVANQLFQIVQALRLTGVDVMVTGIRPEIAQTIVSLGLDFEGIKTQANLKQALTELGVQHIR
ncbi:STAS domain-containing protein [Metabacillus litoralis]|uniref:STAS domain-containing protein n=1 Tax=Metabacillus litoralis TaxID=152268 RepID=UPI001CFC8AA1|nr:STAS domain-containing protein [Metabacillus litoralis]